MGKNNISKVGNGWMVWGKGEGLASGMRNTIHDSCAPVAVRLFDGI